jgi:uncharacterized membrane protein
MTDRYGRALTVFATVGSGLAAGAFLAFSTFVMTALGRLPDQEGLRAMQEINDAAPTPWFTLPLFGTALVCAVLVVIALRRTKETPAKYLLVGSALYLAGIVVTIAYHIPKNDDLALVNSSSPGAADAWNDYRTTWTAWNHVRTLAFLGAAIVFTVALVVSRRTSRAPAPAPAVAEPAGSVHAVGSGVSR